MALSLKWRAVFNAHDFNAQLAHCVPLQPCPRLRSHRLFSREDALDQGAAILLQMFELALTVKRFRI